MSRRNWGTKQARQLSKRLRKAGVEHEMTDRGYMRVFCPDGTPVLLHLTCAPDTWRALLRKLRKHGCDIGTAN